MRGKKATRMSAGQIEEMSLRLQQLQRFIPNSFACKLRGLTEIDRWKATEYRQLLLYTGKIIFKGLLEDDLYNHFMALSVYIGLLVSPRLASLYKEYAQELLEYFVLRGRELYGPEFLVYNVHSMLHISEDIAEVGSLDAHGAFPF